MDNKYFRFLILTVCAVLFAFSLHLSASASPFYNDDGYLTIEGTNYNSSWDKTLIYPSNTPTVDNTVTIPDGYVLYATAVYTGSSSTCRKFWIYYPLSAINDSHFAQLHNASSSGWNPNLRGYTDIDFYVIRNSISSSGNYSFMEFTSSNPAYQHSLQSGYFKFTIYYPVFDDDNNILRPVSDVQFVLNTAFIGDNLSFNCSINSGDASSVSYYFFPASAPISGGSSSSVVSPTPVNQITEEQRLSFFDRGFQVVGQLIQRYGEVIESIGVPKVSLNVSTSVRSSSVFNPDSYNVSYEFLGTGRLFTVGTSSITPSGSISIKDILSRNSGVYAYTQLKLVTVCTYNERSFIATFDFNPSAINDGAPVAPNSLIPSASYPTFGNTQSDFKELADYLKDLYETQNMNDKRNNSNLLAMLNAMPWANFVNTGFVNALPNLSFTLDHLFDSLFDKFTAPTQNQIDEMYAEVQAERIELRDKLAFVDDVKTEYYFVISTITADNNSVPPDFEFSLPSLWSGGQSIRCKLISYEIASPEIMSNIKQVITVFLSLSLLLHIWRTLPSTVGNMPKGGD